MNSVVDVLRDAEERTSPPEGFDLNLAMRRGQARARRRRVLQAASVVATTALVATGVALGWSAATSTTPAGEPEVLRGDDAAAQFGFFSAPQTASDQLPAAVADEAAVVASSTRDLAGFGDAHYWAALNESGYICIVTVVQEAWVSTTCGGIAPGQPGPTSYTAMSGQTARLLPDGYEPSIQEHAGWTYLTPNLAVAEDHLDSPPRGAEQMENVAEYYAVFAEPQRPNDLLVDMGVQPNVFVTPWTSRLVGKYEGARFWVGFDAAAPELSVCLVAVTSDNQWDGNSCTPPLDGDMSGELDAMSFKNLTEVWARLVPDSYEAGERELDVWTFVSPNLAVTEVDPEQWPEGWPPTEW